MKEVKILTEEDCRALLAGSDPVGPPPGGGGDPPDDDPPPPRMMSGGN